jgi:glucose/arabinose dehydrogenase
MQPSISRRRALAVAGATLSIAGCVGDGDGDGSNEGDGTGPDDGGGADGGGGDEGVLDDVPDAVALEPVVDGLGAPVGMAVAPDAGLTYVLEQAGLVRGFDSSGALLEDPVLDLREPIVAGGERGLLGIALHPNFASNRRAFLRYSAPPRDGTPERYSHTFVLASFEASSDGTGFLFETERTILEIPEPQGNHNAGDLAFGPEGYLYVPVGDGGGANDQGTGHVDDWNDAVPGGNGQDVTENLLGSILRLDVDGGDPYAIPEDNPLVGEAGLDEHYAWGLRNPWRISFDRGAEDGADDGAPLYVADVGQSSWEEVNRVEAGGNYGWNVREGAHCFEADSCPTSTPEDVRGGEPLVDPVVEYPHDGDGITGSSIIGGHVFRGSDLPGLQGIYVFGDLRPGGRLFVAADDGGEGLWPTTTVEIQETAVAALYSFGRDANGELYALGNGTNDGTVWRIAPAT